MAATDASHAFAAKWLQAHPELGIALRFIEPGERDARLALDAIGREIELAATHIRETDVAARKLDWWLDELAGAAAGRARHPLTRTHGVAAALARVPVSAWREIVTAALNVREQPPAASLDALLAAPRQLHRALAEVGRRAFGDDAVDAVAEARTLARAFRDALASADALAVGRLPLPLDALARHRLTRGDLALPGAARDAAVREHLAMLEKRMALIDAHRLPVLEAASLHAEHWRCRRASRQRAPSMQGLERMPLGTAWTAWRASRSHRRQGTLP